jgi:hypothetical protein
MESDSMLIDINPYSETLILPDILFIKMTVLSVNPAAVLSCYNW